MDGSMASHDDGNITIDSIAVPILPPPSLPGVLEEWLGHVNSQNSININISSPSLSSLSHYLGSTVSLAAEARERALGELEEWLSARLGRQRGGQGQQQQGQEQVYSQMHKYNPLLLDSPSSPSSSSLMVDDSMANLHSSSNIKHSHSHSSPLATSHQSAVHHANNSAASADRGAKRSRFESDSSLSPASSSTSASASFEQNGTLESTKHATHKPAASLRAASPLLKPVSESKHGKGSDASTVLRNPSLPSIPGLSAPLPPLPGFTKKKQQKQASPVPSISSNRASPQPDQSSTASQSRRPLPPSSLPPRPASLPPKPVLTSSHSHVPHHRDRDRQRERESSQPADARQSSIHSHVSLTRHHSDTDVSKKVKRAAAQSALNEPLQVPTVATTKLAQSVVASNSSSSLSPSPSLSLADGTDGRDGPEHGDQRTKSTFGHDADGMDEDVKPVITGDMHDYPTATADGRVNATTDFVESHVPHRPNGMAVSEAGKSMPSPKIPPSGPIPRKTIPTAAASALGNRPPLSPSLQSTEAQGVGRNGPISRPGTPMARKTLPPGLHSSPVSAAATVVSKADQRANSVVNGGDDVSSTSAAARARTSTDVPPVVVNGASIASSDMNVDDSAAAKEAKRKRKEEKRKRKLAALVTDSTSPQPPGGGTGQAATGSTNAKTNGHARSSEFLNVPNKLRRVEGSTSTVNITKTDSPIAQAGLKVKLNGFTLNSNRSPLSASTGDGHPPPKKSVQIPGVADDFSLPTRSVVPQPPPLVVPTPTPTKQSEVDDDFDHSKPSNQVPYSTFANWVNDFLRHYGEDDLAFLAPKKEDQSCYTVPPLGPHYQDTWAALDADASADFVDPLPPNNSLRPPVLRRFKAEGLTNESLATENVFLGPLSERIMSAFRNTTGLDPMLQGLSSQALAVADSAPASTSNAPMSRNASSEGGPITASGAAQASPQIASIDTFIAQTQITPSIRDLDAVDFETRLSRELAFLGVIPPLPETRLQTTSKKHNDTGFQSADTAIALVDWSNREDDDISCALRACQRLLREQCAINDARRARLTERVRSRIAYQEYETLRDGLEAVIEGAWHKRQRAAQRKAHKDKKDKDKKDRERDREKEASATLAQQIAALNQPQALSASLVTALTKRRNLVDGISNLFPKRSYILPTSSVYEDLNLPANAVSQPIESLPAA